ncbi:ATP-binding cassette domain-containing protein [Agrilactobacillus fermenti]|uniref:ATP-binding cassette domain-containing protein n=1 Tax=Agrilactobacillus fermenti TaxID=2586909 RepID=UPI003A5BE801
MIRLDAVSLTLGHTKILNRCSWSFPDTGLFLLNGPNGIGKTTLFRLLMQDVVADTGKIIFTNASDDIYLVPHEPFMYQQLTGKEFLELIYKVRHQSAKHQINIWQLCQRVHLSQFLDDQIRTYSQGMIKKLALIAAIAANAQVLLLDEVFSGIDSTSIPVFVDQLNQLKLTHLIILVTHQATILQLISAPRLTIKDGQLSDG